jgi:hypothetical protein
LPRRRPSPCLVRRSEEHGVGEEQLGRFGDGADVRVLGEGDDVAVAERAVEEEGLAGELLSRLESIEPNGPAEHVVANFVGGLKRLPVRYRLRA